MSRRPDPKARHQLNDAAATGRRRAQVQEQSSRQRDVALRSRRLLTELAGGGAGGAAGEVSEAALASLGSDVLAERVKVVAATLQRWEEAPPAEWQAALQQLATLLSAGSYEPAQAALTGGAVASLSGLLQLPPAQLPPDAARRAAWALELLANSSPDAAGQVLAAAPVLAARLAAAVRSIAATGAAAAAGAEAELLEADQLAAVLGAVAGWSPDLQGRVLGCGAAAPLLQLLTAIMEPAAAATAQTAGHPAQDEQMEVAAAAGELPPAEAAVVRCCSTALWAVGMMVRGRTEEILQLVTQQPLLAGVRRLLTCPSPSPHFGLLREAAWLLAFCSAGGGPEAVTALVSVGGVLPGLLLATLRCVHIASALSGDEEASHDAAQPLHQALQPLLLTLANIACEPAQALLTLAELQAARPLPPLPPNIQALASAGAGASPFPAPAAAGGPADAPDLYASGMQALLACLQGKVSHRLVVRGGAALAAGLARGVCRSGPVAVDAVRAAFRDSGVVAALVELLRGAALDIRKEAAAALTALCEGAAAQATAGGGGEGGSGPGPGTLDMLRSLGIAANRDENGVLACFLGLLRSPDADAVHAGLRFVTLVLGGVRRGPQLVESLDGIDALEAVQYGTGGCRVPELQTWAEELVDQHYGEGYGEEEDEEDEVDEEGESM